MRFLIRNQTNVDQILYRRDRPKQNLLFCFPNAKATIIIQSSSKFIKFSQRYKGENNNYQGHRVQIKVNDITSNLGTVKNHIKDIYQTIEPSKIVINHDLEMSKSIGLFVKSDTQTFPNKVSFKYQSPSSYDLQSVFPNCSYSFNFMSDRCLQTFIVPLPV